MSLTILAVVGLLGAATDNIPHANRMYLYNLLTTGGDYLEPGPISVRAYNAMPVDVSGGHYKSIDKVKNWDSLTDTDTLAYGKGG
jgi:hypothetical protein